MVKKDTDENIIYVSHGYDPESQYENKVYLKYLELINPNAEFDPDDILFKIRHTPDFTEGKLVSQNDDLFIDSSERIAGVASGQFGVIYDKNAKFCLGSGVIKDKV